MLSSSIILITLHYYTHLSPSPPQIAQIVKSPRMGRYLLSSSPAVRLSFSSSQLTSYSSQRRPIRHGQIRAVVSERIFPKISAESTGPIPASELLQVVESAAKTGAEVQFRLLGQILIISCETKGKFRKNVRTSFLI